MEYINRRNTENIEELKQVIDGLTMQIAELNDQINLKNTTIEALQLEKI